MELQSCDETENPQAAIQIWCASHLDHQRAWDHIGMLNQRFGILADLERARVAESALTQSRFSRRNALKILSIALVASGAALSLYEMGVIDRWDRIFIRQLASSKHLHWPMALKSRSVEELRQPFLSTSHVLSGLA